MTMSVRCDGCGLEYSGARQLPGLFPRGRNWAHRPNLLRPHYLRLLAEVPRFHRQARRLLDAPDGDDASLATFLAIGGYSRYFVDHFMLPVVSAVWSSRRPVVRRVPGPIPVPIPGAPRAAGGERLTDLAHGGRRFPKLRRAGGQGTRRRRTGDPGARGAPRRNRRRCPGPHRGRHGAPLRPRCDRHPPGPGTYGCWPSPPSWSARCSGHSATAATRPGCTRTPRCCQPRRTPARPGTTCTKRSCASTDAPVLVSYRHEPAAAAARVRRSYLVTLNGDWTASTPNRVGVGQDELPAPDLHAGVRRGPSGDCRS